VIDIVQLDLLNSFHFLHKDAVELYVAVGQSDRLDIDRQ
jgi:hypothetical protein